MIEHLDLSIILDDEFGEHTAVPSTTVPTFIVMCVLLTVLNNDNSIRDSLIRIDYEVGLRGLRPRVYSCPGRNQCLLSTEVS